MATQGCIRCGKKGALRCSSCKLVYYCSPECQKQHWISGHKGQCVVLREKKSAEYITPSSTASSNPSNIGKPAPQQQSKSVPLKKSAGGVGTLNFGPSGVPEAEYLFAPARVKNFMTFRPRQSIGVGLLNAGNTCYINAALQCISNTQPLQTYLLSSDHSSSCKLSSHQFCVFCALEEHTKQLMEQPDSFFPKKIFYNLQSIGNFRRNTQEDAHEFVHSMLAGMQNSIAHNYEVKHDGKKLDHEHEETSLIYQLFGGYTRSQLKCDVCGYIVARREPFLDLNLELSMGASIEEALFKFTEIEKFDLETGYKCEKCNKVVTAKKQLTIDQSPNILVIQLKRFDVMHGGGKINKSVVFRTELDLNPIMSEDKKWVDGHTYQLYAVLVHYGRTMFVGHYVAFVKVNGRWLLFDDDKIYDVNPAIVLKQNAYILFYEKVIKDDGSAKVAIEPVVTSPKPAPKPQQQNKKRRNKGKKKGQQQPQQATTQEAGPRSTESAPQQAEKEEKVEAPIQWEIPKYTVHYREGEDNDDSFLKDFIISVDLSALDTLDPGKVSLVFQSDGHVVMKAHNRYHLELALPFTVDIKRGEASYYKSTKGLVITVPILSTFAPDDEEVGGSGVASPETHQVSVALKEGDDDLKELIAGAHELELASLAPPKEEEKENDKKEALPFLQFTRESYMKMLADESNKEEASYARLYDDIREYQRLQRKNPEVIAKGGAEEDTAAAAMEFAKMMKKVKRNDMCPCGSGKKFKTCHGKDK